MLISCSILALAIGGGAWWRLGLVPRQAHRGSAEIEHEPPTDASPEIRVTESELFLNRTKLCDLPPLEEQIHRGAGAVCKGPPRLPLNDTCKGGRDCKSAYDELFLPILSSTLSSRVAQSAPAERRRAVVTLSPSTPYRLAMEVLFTLGQTEFAEFDLAIPSSPSGPAMTVRSIPPPATTQQANNKRGPQVVVLILTGGIALKFDGKAFGPGCHEGQGLVTTNEYLRPLFECIQTLRARSEGLGIRVHEAVALAANPGVPASWWFRVLAMAICGSETCLAASSTPARRFFENVWFKVPR